MPKMTMPFRGRTITTSVSGGGSGVLVLLAVLVAAAVAVPVAVTLLASLASLAAVIEVVLAVAVVAGLAAVVVPPAVALLTDAVTWPWERRTIARFRAHEDAMRAAARARRLAREEAAAEALTALDAEPAAGLDGTRDGRLIDAANRFRRLGTLLPDDDRDVVDAEIVDDHARPGPTTLDREA